jgi:hypothetical protein
MIANKAILVHEFVESKCTECWTESTNTITKVYCDECEKPTGFNNIPKYHGLAAFTGKYSMKHVLNNLTNIIEHPEYQICCSTNKINGSIAIEIIECDVLLASNMDLCTYIDPENNRRYYEYDNEYDPDPTLISMNNRHNYIISDISELDSSIWNHNELVTTNNKIKRIILKTDNNFTNEELSLLEQTANELNLEISIID